MVDAVDDAFQSNAKRSEAVVAELVSRPTESAEPLYFLVIGSDSREGVDKSLFGDFAGARGDVVMLVRLDPDQSRAHILSVPRDTWVPIDGHGEGKINAAFAHGGAALMVKTVRQVFDVPIHHYVEVDFAGFQALVDELGGVEMTFAHQARDAKSRLDVPAGEVRLDGYQALAYARSRTYQELVDGTWRTVDGGDLGRAARQQALVRAIAEQLKRPSNLADTGEVVASIAQHVTVDAALADASLTRLAFSLRGLSGADISSATLPTMGANRGGASVQEIDRPAARAVLEAFRSGQPMDNPVAESILSVDVLNGNGIDGSAAGWAARLEGEGYEVNRIDDAKERVATTTVLVASPHLAAAEQMIEELGFGATRVGSVPDGVDAVVILGADAEQPVS